MLITHLTERKKVIIMIAIMVAVFFSAVNQTIIGVAMPRIIAKLGGMDYYTWVITIYLLTMAVASVLVGKLSDIYGRKPFILSGIGLFTIGALLMIGVIQRMKFGVIYIICILDHYLNDMNKTLIPVLNSI